MHITIPKRFQRLIIWVIVGYVLYIPMQALAVCNPIPYLHRWVEPSYLSTYFVPRIKIIYNLEWRCWLPVKGSWSEWVRDSSHLSHGECTEMHLLRFCARVANPKDPGYQGNPHYPRGPDDRVRMCGYYDTYAVDPWEWGASYYYQPHHKGAFASNSPSADTMGAKLRGPSTKEVVMGPYGSIAKGKAVYDWFAKSHNKIASQAALSGNNNCADLVLGPSPPPYCQFYQPPSKVPPIPFISPIAIASGNTFESPKLNVVFREMNAIVNGQPTYIYHSITPFSHQYPGPLNVSDAAVGNSDRKNIEDYAKRNRDLYTMPEGGHDGSPNDAMQLCIYEDNAPNAAAGVIELKGCVDRPPMPKPLLAFASTSSILDPTLSISLGNPAQADDLSYGECKLFHGVQLCTYLEADDPRDVEYFPDGSYDQGAERMCVRGPYRDFVKNPSGDFVIDSQTGKPVSRQVRATASTPVIDTQATPPKPLCLDNTNAACVCNMPGCFSVMQPGTIIDPDYRPDKPIIYYVETTGPQAVMSMGFEYDTGDPMLDASGNPIGQDEFSTICNPATYSGSGVCTPLTKKEATPYVLYRHNGNLVLAYLDANTQLARNSSNQIITYPITLPASGVPSNGTKINIADVPRFCWDPDPPDSCTVGDRLPGTYRHLSANYFGKPYASFPGPLYKAESTTTTVPAGEEIRPRTPYEMGLCLDLPNWTSGVEHVFDSNGTSDITTHNFVANSDCNAAVIELWGGGGAGDFDPMNNRADGGGGGAYIKFRAKMNPGTAYGINVGLGGNQTLGKHGQNSWVNQFNAFVAGGANGRLSGVANAPSVGPADWIVTDAAEDGSEGKSNSSCTAQPGADSGGGQGKGQLPAICTAGSTGELENAETPGAGGCASPRLGCGNANWGKGGHGRVKITCFK